MAIFVAISYQGLSFFPTKFLPGKTKYTPQKKTNARHFGVTLAALWRRRNAFQAEMLNCYSSQFS